MATITTRSGKGSPLTNDEVDSNFTNLDTDKVEKSGDTMTGNLSLGDNNKVIFGAGSDLQIYHSGTASIIDDAGQGDLIVRSSGSKIRIYDQANTQNMANFFVGGSVQLYHNGSEKLETTSTGIVVTGTVDVTGTVTADGLDASTGDIKTTSIGFNGSRTTTPDGLSYPIIWRSAGAHPDFNSGDLVIQARSDADRDIHFVTGNTPTERMNIDGQTGDISFYEDTGTTAKLTWDASAESLKFADNGKAIFGAGSDLQIYHDGGHSYIDDAGTGLLRLRSNTVYLEKYTGELLADFNADGYVSLLHDNSEKFRTTSTGIDVTGTVTADGLDLDIASSAGTDGIDFNRSGGTSSIAGVGSYSQGIRVWLDKTDSSGYDLFEVVSRSTEANRFSIDNDGDISFYEDTGTTPKFVWDASAEQLKIGTIAGAAGGSFAVKTDSNGYALAIEENSGTERWSVGVDVDGDLGFFNSGDTTASVTFDDSGNVGIGTSSPATALDVTGTVTADGLTVDGTLGSFAVDNQGVIASFSRPSTSYIRATDASGSLRIDTGGSTARAFFSNNGDISFYEDTGTTAKLTWDASAESLKFADNGKAIFGAGSDLEIYSDGSTSYIREAGSGNLRITGASVQITDPSFNKYFLGSGDIARLYHSDAQKLATTSTGVDVTGKVVSDELAVEGTNGTFSVDSLGFIVGMSRPSANFIQASSATGSMIFQTGGANNRLALNSNGDISFYEDTGTTAKFFWDASAESLGIGTTVPSKKFVVSDGGAMGVEISPDDSGNGYSRIINYDRTTNQYEPLRIEGEILQFSTGTTATEKVRIDASGRVGIGSSTPNYLLDVEGSGALMRINSTSGNSLLQFSVPDATSITGINFGDSGSSNSGYMYYRHTGDSLAFGTAGAERMRINSAGNVGIGTSSPVKALDIVAPNGGQFRIASATADATLKNAYHSVRHFRTAEEDFIWAVATSSSNNSLKLGGGTSLGNAANTLLFYTTANNKTTTGSERMRIDASGNTLFGTTLTPAALSTTSNNADQGVGINSSGLISGANEADVVLSANRLGTDGAIASFRKNGSEVGSIGTNGDYPYFANTTRGIKMVGSALFPTYSSGQTAPDLVDIGGSSSKFKDLHLSGVVNAAQVNLKDGGGTLRNVLDLDGSSNLKVSTGASSGSRAITFFTENEEQMRLGSSGNLLVGTTDSSPHNNTGTTSGGIALHSDAYLSVGRYNGAAMFINRQSTNGAIADFRKDGTTVGIIGSYLDDRLFVGTGDTNLNFFATGDAVYPSGANGNTRDGAINLGASFSRFKDLYLSGGAYLGGVAAANKLDDYEEGTFTPTLEGATTDPSYTADKAQGRYTKVGNRVTCAIHITASSLTVGVGNTRIGGLPFTSASSGGTVGFVGFCTGFGTNNSPTSVVINNAGSVAIFRKRNAANGNINDVSSAAALTSDVEVIVEVTYETA